MSGLSSRWENPHRRGLPFPPMRWLPAAILAFLAAGAPATAAAELPVVRIDAARAIPDEPKVPARLRMPGYQGRIGIERRGQSSQMFPKKSYAIELRDRKGQDRKVPLHESAIAPRGRRISHPVRRGAL